MNWFWTILANVVGLTVLHVSWPGWWRVSTHVQPRQCQYCDNVINKWRAAVGVLNCNDCVYRMQYGPGPTCRKTTCDNPRHGHSH